MPSLRELLHLTAERFGADPERVSALERELRMQWGGQRIYIPPPESRKDPARTEVARELAKRLPTGIVAQRTGLSPGYVRHLVRSAKK